VHVPNATTPTAIQKRWLWVAIVALCISGAIGIRATFDHTRKTAAMNEAEMAAWYCQHGFIPSDCSATNPATLERRWNVREKFYEAGFAAGLAIFAAAVFKITCVEPGRRSLTG
jgi:hypothetical protein